MDRIQEKVYERQNPSLAISGHCGYDRELLIWEQTKNPWMILQDVSQERLEQLAEDSDFKDELRRLAKIRKSCLDDPGWYGKTHQDAGLKQIAYFSMEFGLGEALPLYAGGLGILAGDYLKAASDLSAPKCAER